MSTPDITISQMLMLYTFILIPIFILLYLRITLVGKLLIAVARMTVQLALVGLYLRYLFELNSIYLNVLWIAVMTIAASSQIFKSDQLKSIRLLIPVLCAVFLSLFVVILPFIVLVIRPEPLYDARYLIPLSGMLLGNCLSANIISVNNYINLLRRGRKEFQTALCSGATRFEAALPSLRASFKLAFLPTVTTISSLGIISLPGMMTGQLLAGAFPIVAIKYQIAIMIAILACCSLGIFLVLNFLTIFIFDQRDNLKLELLKKIN